MTTPTIHRYPKQSRHGATLELEEMVSALARAVRETERKRPIRPGSTVREWMEAEHREEEARQNLELFVRRLIRDAYPDPKPEGPEGGRAA